MTLEKYVKNYMEATNCKHELGEILNLIKREAQKKAQNGCTVFDEKDVEEIIDNSTSLLKTKSQKSVEPKVVTPKATTQKKEYKKTTTPKSTPKPIAKASNKKESLDSEFDFEQLGLF